MIHINLDKAKEISHDKRRTKREELFKQLDIEATVPVLAEQAEQQRQTIRSEFATLQTRIDGAASVDELKEVIKGLL